MMQKVLIVIIDAVVLVLSVAWMHAGGITSSQTHSVPQNVLRQRPRLIGALEVAPAWIPVGAQTTITATVRITRIASHPAIRGVALLQLGPTGTPPIILGMMHDDGLNGDVTPNDGIYTLRLPLVESALGQVQLEASLAFHDGLGIKHMLSPAFNLAVTNLQVSAQTPATWEAYSSGSAAMTLYSPESMTSLASGDDEVPPDITIAMLPNPTRLSLSAFIQSYQDGWYASYNSITQTTIAGYPAVEVEDSDAAVPSSPTLAAFVAAGESEVYLVTGQEADSLEFNALLKSLDFH